MQWAKKHTGFTIVELLIVIVVIAILAAITIVAYSGIQQRAESSSAQSALSQVAKKITTYAVENNDTYPNNLDSIGVDTSEFQYYTTGSSYCLMRTSGTETYFQTNAWPSPSRGTCYGLVAWYPFNNSADDFSGRGHHALTETNLTVTTGASGQQNSAYNFNGIDSKINTTYSSALDVGTPELTFSAWVNIETFGSATKAIISRNAPYLLWVEPDSSLRSGLRTNSAWIWSTTTPGSLTLNQWTHLAVTYNGTQRNSYINGVLATTDTSLTGSINTNSIGLNIGFDACCGGRYYFDGSMDDIRIYNRALSQQEIAQLYSIGAL